MNVLFLTMSKMLSIEQRDIYSDLMRKFRDKGHKVYIVSPTERRDKRKTMLIEQKDVHILLVKTLNVQKTNIVEKGIGQLSIEYLYKRAIKKYFNDVRFDLILYSTPPITFPNVIRYAKKANQSATTYLLLKDIFPQNAVDMGMISKTGFKGLLYMYFHHKEKMLYALSDYIGCMSPANVRYVLEHNPEITPDRVEIAPNSIDIGEYRAIDETCRKLILDKYNLPIDKPIFIYGGNLGVPQGVPFLIECLNANKDRSDCHFVVVGDGTYFHQLEQWQKESCPSSVSVMENLPKEEYDNLVKACNIGLIFLDYRFTIPNFPSRLLSYLKYKLPVVCATDPNCDMGKIANENGFGLWLPSNSVESFTASVDKILKQDIKHMGMMGYEFLRNNYLVDHTFNQIIKHIN